MSPITLVAMVPSGEACITRAPSGRLWLHKAYGAGGAGPIDEGQAALAVAKHGFVAVNRQFESWVELDSYLEQEAAKVVPPVVVDRTRLGLLDARGLLETCRRWAGDGDVNTARRLALNLLEVPAVVADPDTHGAVVAFLKGLSEPGPLRMAPPPPGSVVQVRGRERWEKIRGDQAA